MDYDTLVDMLVANNFGRMINGSFRGNNVLIESPYDIELENAHEFNLVTNSDATRKKLEALFEYELSVSVL